MSTAVKTVEILTTLEDDPHVTFFSWEMDVHDTAAGMAKSIHSHGLLSAILTDAQWSAYPGNTSVDAQGQTQIAPRYVPPVYTDIHNGMTNIEMYVAKAGNDKLQVWMDSCEVLKRAVIKSLGRVIRQIVRQVKVHFQCMSVFDIIAKVKARFGKMQPDTKINLKERMLTMLKTTDGLDTHISDLQDMFNVSETAGFPIDRDRQIEILRETVCGHPMITKVFEDFDHDFPDTQMINFDQITAYLILHLPNVRYAQMTATRASANLVAATAYTALEAESKALRAEVETLKRKTNPATNRTNKKNKKKQLSDQRKQQNDQRTTTAEPTAALKYCHGHGYQKSHTSAECRT